MEFGEKVLWRKKKGDRMAKLRSRWSFGVFLGVRSKSGEMWVAAKIGEILKVRAVRRIPVESRWSGDCVEWVKHTPWNRYRGDPDADGEVPEGKSREAREEEGDGGSRPAGDLWERKYVAPRRFRIAIDDAKRHGYTRGCGGCTSWFKGLGRQPHTDQCGSRFEEAVKE